MRYRICACVMVLSLLFSGNFSMITVKAGDSFQQNEEEGEKEKETDLEGLEITPEDQEETVTEQEELNDEKTFDEMEGADQAGAEQEDVYSTDGADQNIENEMVENSWRYTEGEWTPPIMQSRGAGSGNAWSKVDGVYVNDKGEEIKGAIAKGIDVSYHNGRINWEQVKKSDVDFVILRCGYGKNQTNQDDKQWEYNVKECTRLGIPFGVYLYSYAMSTSDALSEAEHVLRLVKGYNLSFPVFYDMENEKAPYNQGGLPSRVLGDIAETFCNKIESAGYDVGIYANKNWFENKLTDKRFQKWSKWVAQYNSYCTYNGEYSMWQSTSSGKVPGIQTNVDINFLFSDWSYSGVEFMESSPQVVGSTVTIKPSVSGDTSDLQYKYVWMKNSWKENGTIQDFSSNATAKWTPKTDGEYWIYVDIKDRTGKIVTKSAKFQIDKWGHEGVEFVEKSPQVIGSKITVKPVIKGDTSGLQYKFVWMKNGWKESGTIQNFSSKASAEWTPKSSGEYWIYVDVKDGAGKVVTKSAGFVVDKWGHEGVEFSPEESQTLGKSITIKPVIKGDTEGLQYKYVWMKNGWKENGTIQNFSSKASAEWTPKSSGEYWIYVDVKDETGKVVTKSAPFKVLSDN